MKSTPSPIYVWPVAIILFLALQWGMYAQSAWLFPAEDAEVATQTLIAQRTAAQMEVNKPYYHLQQIRHPDAYHVVIIGSSLTMDNIACTDDLLAYGQRQFDTDIVVTKFFSPSRPLEVMVKQGGLFEALLQAPPDLLLIEHDMVCFEFIDPAKGFRKPIKKGANKKKSPLYQETPIDHSFLARLKATRLEIMGIFRQNRLNLIAFAKNSSFQTAPAFTSNPCGELHDIPQQVDTLSIAAKQRFMYDMGTHAYAHKGIRSLQATGTDVALFHIPRPAPLEKAHAQAPEQQDMMALIQQYEQQLDIAFWHCPLELPYHAYRDIAHMNAKGRDKYSKWLLSTIYQSL